MQRETDYVLGTHDDEVDRLAIQHRAWRSRVLAAWRRAGFGPGHTLLDIGCGPGYAALDLSEIVGPTGRVVAIDRSRRFLGRLETMRRQRNIVNIDIHQMDLAAAELPAVIADGAWCRWILTFVERPRDLLERVRTAIRPGGRLVVHEYFDYATWKISPRSAPVEEFVTLVMNSWRSAGGEPDVGLHLPRWLHEIGFEVVEVRPIIDVVPPGDALWTWLRVFVDRGRRRLVDLGLLTPSGADEIWKAFITAETTPGTWMITPGVLEVVAVRR
jgi:SAM-dependent methyltransferase